MGRYAMIHDTVKHYYGEELTSSDDLKTDACCTNTPLPDHIKDALSNIHDEVLSKYYGCGLIAPDLLKGTKILDLGSGSGRDVYVLAQLVGEEGEIVGVDMTDNQLEVANAHKEWHRKQFGYQKSNVTFLKGEIEKLHQLPLQEGYFDIVVSNCVINLSTDKEAVLKGAKQLLKQGGEIYFSDVYSDRRIPQELREDPVLYGECLSGALYINDFIELAKKVGFGDPRMVEGRKLAIHNRAIEEKVGDIKFYSISYRLFNIKNLEPLCEDYGQSVIYKGTILTDPTTFILDNHHTILKDQKFSVCGNSYRILFESRYKNHFTFDGDFSVHYGPFAGCGGSLAFDKTANSSCCGVAEENCDMSVTAKNSPPATIKTEKIKELWFHTGTDCNLSCPNCLEGSHPGDNRIEKIQLAEVKSLIDEAVETDIEQFSFTGGEPFAVKESIATLSYALQFRPCLILTNGTLPFQKRWNEIQTLIDAPHPLSFRVSLDHCEEEKHDRARGKGNFMKALASLKILHDKGFLISVARHIEVGENFEEVDNNYRKLFREYGIPEDTHIIAFPELYPPYAKPEGIPVITEKCMEKVNPNQFMCSFSRMVVKKKGKLGVYACTLVDDDECYDLGATLAESLTQKVPLRHHRCFSCYAQGASCSEL